MRSMSPGSLSFAKLVVMSSTHAKSAGDAIYGSQSLHSDQQLKGTMSPGFCSFFVITVLIIQLATLFHAENVAFTAKGRYQANFRIDTKLLLVLSDFFQDTTIQFEKVGPTFSNCNPFPSKSTAA